MLEQSVLTRVDLRRVWAVVAAGLLVWVCVRSLQDGVLDLRVYLEGGKAWWSGAGLYGEDFTGPLGLPFTYPPFAAMLFSGLTALPLVVTAALFTAGGIALLTAACQAAASRISLPWAGFGLAAVCLLLEPLRVTLDLGQINLILIGLVATDCLLPRTPWPRGMLVGLAAAIKLTPAIFVLFFLCRRRWRPALTAAGTFAVAGLIGWVLAPGESKRFWFDAMLDPSRVGGLAYTANQSLRGLLFRLGAPVPVWAVSCLLVLAVLVFVLPRLRDDLTAVLAVAAAGLLISPVSWSHHWVWIAPALLVLRGWVRIAAGAVFAVGPHWLLPATGDQELAWTWWQHLIGNTYVWLGLGFLGWCVVQAVRHRSPGEPVEVGEPARYLVAGSGSLPSSARAFRTMSASSWPNSER
ncbi:glycosyltransferase 87 family protein [Lentzea flava]|uniref:Membrane protein n=1 Tax=Lentzea flava TaxID=103732 RepID=A0ABQ2UBJ3_9PSEU|nr:glycosyltransferase 87 family protein [Lentzea flava]MCP2196456.1 alpha-1,2-mannosyltransferase [Lentzea flava]GGU17685.1 membrane protein [Lentzea flava]